MKLFQYLLNFQTSAYFEVEIMRIEQIIIRKHNGTRKAYGNYLVKEPIGNDFLTTIKAYKKQGGEYRLMPYKISTKPFCDFMNEDKYMIPEFFSFVNISLPMPCPLLPVSHKCTNLI